MVVESQPIRHELRGFAHRLVAPKFQLLVFDASPEALDKHVVHPATFAVHPDLNTVPFDRLYPFRTRKLRALICIKKLGLAARPLKRPLESSDTKFSAIELMTSHASTAQVPSFSSTHLVLFQGCRPLKDQLNSSTSFWLRFRGPLQRFSNQSLFLSPSASGLLTGPVLPSF
jgi:hypothetical protein